MSLVGATHLQDRVRRRRGLAAAALALAVASAGALAVRRGAGPDSVPVGAATATPATPLSATPACPASSNAGPAQLDIAGFTYCPETFTVVTGADVVWTNVDAAPHTVTFAGPNGQVDSGSMVQGQSWSTRFDTAGTYRYYCRLHPGMEGKIVVEAR